MTTTEREPMTRRAVGTGAEALAADPSPLEGRRIALLTNATGTLPGFERNIDVLLSAGVEIAAVLTPEHGLRGSAQAGDSESDSVDETTGLPVIDTYGSAGPALDELLERSGAESVVFDMQDVGTRYWTYTWTMFDALASAARTGLPFTVLDRPNPLGGELVEGPGVRAEFSSFVGRVDIPQRHALTSGELALRFNRCDIPAWAERAADLRVIPLSGWNRGMRFEETGLPWVAPSPNLPTLDSALAFAGTGLIEGTNLSEGRGTTRPFELIGAPYLDGRLIASLRELGLPGVAFREVWFVPTFHKYAGETVRGLQLHVSDRDAFRPVACALAIIGAAASLYPDEFRFLPPRPDAPADEAGFAIDRLWGSDSLRETVEASGDPSALVGAPSRASAHYPADLLLYPEAGE